MTPEDISCFKVGKAYHEGLEKLKELFGTLEYLPEEMPEEEEPEP